MYLKENPLLKEPLKIEHIKTRLLGHWGSDPGQTLVWTHLNRLIREQDLNMIYISGPGHGAPSMLSHAWLEGTYGEVYPDKGQGEEGMRAFLKQFSFPGGIGSHCTPETPGSLHEGGELGYSLSHAFGVAFDNPDLIAACVIGDGESETGPLATSWHGNKFLNPAQDGAVLPILHLNGYKIANPTILARISPEQLESLLRGYGYKPYVVEFHVTMTRQTIAPDAGRHPGCRDRRDPPDPATCPHRGRAGDAPMAHDRFAFPQGLDRPQRSGRAQGGGLLACPPDSRRPAQGRRRTWRCWKSGCAVTSRSACSRKMDISSPS